MRPFAIGDDRRKACLSYQVSVQWVNLLKLGCPWLEVGHFPRFIQGAWQFLNQKNSPHGARLNRAGVEAMIRPLQGRPERNFRGDEMQFAVCAVALTAGTANTAASFYSPARYSPARCRVNAPPRVFQQFCLNPQPGALRLTGSLSFPVNRMAGPADRCLMSQRGSPRSRTITPIPAPAVLKRVQHGQQNDHRCIAPGGDPGGGAARQPRRGI